MPPSVITLCLADGVATVTLRGDIDVVSCAKVRERIAGVLENCPRRLVLDLGEVSDRHGDRIIAIIAAARQELPPGRVLEVCSASPAVRQVLTFAGWSGVRLSPAGETSAFRSPAR